MRAPPPEKPLTVRCPPWGWESRCAGRPNSTDFDQSRSRFADVGQIWTALAKLGPIAAKVDLKLARTPSNSCAPARTQLRAGPGEHWPGLGLLRPEVGNLLAKLAGGNRAEFSDGRQTGVDFGAGLLGLERARLVNLRPTAEFDTTSVDVGRFERKCARTRFPEQLKSHKFDSS